jgi:A-macroglobulin TED domain/Alpha-2-macroglobulin family/MG2 domain/Carboxypeptidase regulatory-like domain/A-macroglobulin receptor binding domain/Alpha-2-macroglobulin bait region domain/Macroglobulin domain MG3
MRHRLIGSVLVCLFSASIFAARYSANSPILRVNESATKFSLKKEGAVVSLAVENSGSSALTALVKLELIDPRDAVRATAMIEASIPSGSGVSTVPMVKIGVGDYDVRELLWHRLRYDIAAIDSSGKETDSVPGLISLSQITPDIFRLLISAPQEVGKEAKYSVRARALHPLTGKPGAGVNVEAGMAYEEGDDERKLKSSGVTDSTGEALLEFKLPGPLIADHVEIKVVARREGFLQEANAVVSLLHMNQILVSTDKPLYQPGQTLHVRVLALDRDRKAWANVDGKLKISDMESTTHFGADFKTSRFGVADVDWKIPDGARLGEYSIEAHIGEESPRRAAGLTGIKISRYDLPNFVVNVKPDRGYYLPGQNAEVEVRADYLFGQPVKRGRVRVVRETERRWNYREQKWETEEGDKYEGALDGAGRFIARVDLAEEHKDFKPDSYSRFRDLRYAAYLTDSTTGRTEQRRFDLRVTEDPIHVYLIERVGDGDGSPLQFYISTFYADGSPAQCEVTINRVFGAEVDDESKAGNENVERILMSVKTNRYGVAKVASLDAGKTEGNDDLRLKLTARDDQGRSGRDLYNYGDRHSPAMRVEIDKTLYRAGEPIKARLTSNSPRANWVVDLMRGSRLLAMRAVQLKDGRAEIAFPFNQEFAGELMIVAYPAFSDNYDAWNSAGVARVLYPRDRELKLDLKFDQASYRPGDEARADLRVLTPQGRYVESALGVVVFDKAIEERARTDQEFRGGGFGFYDCFRGLLGAGGGLSGVTRRDLDRIDLSKPLPEGLELVAEIMLNQREYSYYRPDFFRGDEFETDAEQVFKPAITAGLRPVEIALSSQYSLKSIYPIDETTLRRQMLLAEIELDELRDPWGTPYRPKFSVEGGYDVFELISAGPDKRLGTDDDFTAFSRSWQYFVHAASAITRTVENHHARTGGFIRDRETLKRELMSREALDIEALGDRWGNPYRFEFGVERTFFTISVKSGGPNGKFEDGRERWMSDDFILGGCLIDYGAEIKARIDRALSAHFMKTKLIPQNESELREALKRAGVDFDELRDGWGNRYYATFRTTSRYSDRVTQFDQARYGEKPKPKTEIIPVTQQYARVTIRSLGADGKEGTHDDFDVTDFSQIVFEESAKEAVEKIATQSGPKVVNFPGEGGAIAGTVTDANDAVISNVTVNAKHVNSGSVWASKTNTDGAYLLRDLAPGIYEVRFDMTGFKSLIINAVAVYSSKLTKVDAKLEAGGVTETVMVTADVPRLMTESSSVSIITRSGMGAAGPIAPNQIATPRLREYFPETLLWRPEIETDKQGRAHLKFKLADNITTWKMSVVGSTVDGEIGIAEKEFRAFQPFFAEHDPPKVLTEGDEISLPVVLRNYLDKTQTVNAEVKPESWFELLGAARKRAEIKAGDAGQVVFDFRAVAPVKDGKQRVTAFGSDASDAVEKPVSVHPDGEEVAQTASEIFGESGSLDVVIPIDAIKGSVLAELKIYPNLIAHALEGIEGILRRPYGCAEQTISSTYPSLMILRYFEPQSEKLSALMRKTAEKARRYAQAGYERLLGYRAESGGFSYWGRDEADLALTAYALRFLNDAGDFIGVDEDVIAGARKFIISSQQPDGRWPQRYRDEREDAKRTALNTAFITRVLAMEKGKEAKADKEFAAALSRALDYLAKRIEEIDEPYLIASYALAAMDAGEKKGVEKAVAKLRTLAREEAGTSYWNLESNTPFYGWGLAGRIETTALAVNALKRAGAAEIGKAGERDKAESLTNRGLLFLLRNKDRHGVWLSTQATINVLDTLISLNEGEVAMSGATGGAEIVVNGKRVSSVAMPPAGQLSNPITVELSSFLSRGNNRVEIRRSGYAARASAQVVETHYEPWEQGAAARSENFRLRNSSALRLAVNYDKLEAKIGASVVCNVTAERVGHSGYGMMLAEIGLPPGADVDRESLERAAQESGWSLNHYDVLPDRVIAYLWPRAGGLKFSFKFKPRYGVKAQTAPSALYDYYNPEARVALAPSRFVVK